MALLSRQYSPANNAGAADARPDDTYDCHYSEQDIDGSDSGIYNDEHLLGTPDKRLDELTWPERFADSLSLSDDGTPEHSRQISPASVLPTISAPPIKTLLDRSQFLQNYVSHGSPTCQAADFQKLRHQHAQLLEFNHMLVEENNQRLEEHAELVSELMSANQRLYQAEQTSATAVANAAQLQGEVLRLSNQMDELSLDLQTQSSLAETQQDELEAVHQHLTQQQRSNLAKMEKQGWEAADWKARALEATQKLAAANAQIAEQARIIVAQEQKYLKDITAMNAQLMHYSAMVGIQSFSPADLADDVDDDDDATDTL
ncbi:hypothetical protein ABBQ38_001425 [Trebouxia sp. C0009 RCD-2024]